MTDAIDRLHRLRSVHDQLNRAYDLIAIEDDESLEPVVTCIEDAIEAVQVARGNVRIG